MAETSQFNSVNTSETKHLAVSEIFGPTFQGEGASLGRLCVFLRLGGCNLHCTWCDTPYTWDAKRYNLNETIHRVTLPEVAEQLWRLIYSNPYRTVPRVVVSGGEPTLQGKGLHQLISNYMRPVRAGKELAWEMETNGTVIPDMPSDLFDQYNVSVKLGNSGNLYHERIKPVAIDWFLHSGRAYWKFVVSRLGDFDEIDDLVRGHFIPNDRVFIMPEGTDQGSIIFTAQKLAEEVLDRGWNLTTRLHVLLWGNTPGR